MRSTPWTRVPIVGLLTLAIAAGGAVPALAAAPSNDNFANAAVLSGTAGSLAGTTAEATGETNEPCHWHCDDHTSVWYTMTPGVRGLVTLNVTSEDFNPMIAVYRGSSLATLTLLDWNADAHGETTDAALTLLFKAGTTYRIAVDRQSELTGPFQIDWSTVPSPSNDDFAAAAAIAGAQGSIAGTTVAATTETNEPCHSVCGDASSVWYRWTAPFTGTAVFGTRDSDFDTGLAVYQGNVVSNLDLLTWDDNTGPGTEALMSFLVQDGLTYRIAVDRSAAEEGTFTLFWFPGRRPDAMIKLGRAAYVGNNVYNATASGQTVSTRGAVGTKKTFTIKIENDGSLRDGYRLQGPGTANGYAVKYLAGATGTTNITSAVVGGTYRVTGINVGGSKTIRMIVTLTSRATASRSLLLTARSLAEGTRRDAVKAVIRRA